MNERDIHAEIERMRSKRPNLHPSDVARRFGKSIFWARSRLYRAEMPKKVKTQLDNMCDIRYCMPDKNTLMGGLYFCTSCMEYVDKGHFIVATPQQPKSGQTLKSGKIRNSGASPKAGG